MIHATMGSDRTASAASLAARLRGLAWRIPAPGTSPVLTGLVLAVACGSVAAPLFFAAYLPFVDYPQHLATVAANQRCLWRLLP